MKQNIKNSGNRSSRIFNRFAAEKKKTTLAVCLIAVMVFMWVRVLGRKEPQSANAAIMAQKVTEDQMNSKLKVSFVELPKVEGRNDVLTRDFFTVGSWRDFVRGGEGKPDGIGKINVVSGNDSEGIVRRVAEKLRLEAIVLGESPRAFINDKLLSVGDQLFVGDETSMYECEVVKIEENTVFIRCGEAEVTLRLTQTLTDN